jgi:AcrR family transcriptional regulator
MSKPSHCEAILQAGLKVMFRSGYQGATVRDICAAAGVPQGSFTNHFRSKEAFAQEVLDRYFANLQGYVREALDDKSLTPRQRLKRYLDLISGVLEDAKWNRGCLIGDFSLETASQSKLLRERLEGIFQECALRLPRVSPRLKPPVKSIHVRSDGSRRIPPGFLGGRHSPYEGRTRPCRARSLQEDRFPNHILQTT